ncbi:hypothetical protein SAMN05444008_11848 [Cnuella takakiae]|uniref:DUF1415 domain-containing protein n=1 Tax=Cnuella takakiae TaxID=1302690 RepID=A0A1M5H6A4_9BACT|nr:DUF1415 domain-containing protein [Cnuella takakiae]OLY91097.1 hypothetical protein BUE76_03660 [Cnuella takakiae]SHG11445.1 hypothetical protein SAMN05444008_11848 [Cnuella takakiae]
MKQPASPEVMIAQTKKWIVDVVVGCNFCPFAAREVKRDSILFEVLENAPKALVLADLRKILQQLDNNPDIETAFLILPQNFNSFSVYLRLVDAAEVLLRKEGYEGIYQVASFHPGYLFAGSSPSDPANYTNRSPYPMLHLLREASVSRVVDAHPNPHAIPETNTAFARQKGLVYMAALREACMEVK